jgi:hypothetical protein
MDVMRRSSLLPTVVLVHGAFADASGFAGVIRELQSAHVPVRAAAVPRQHCRVPM